MLTKNQIKDFVTTYHLKEEIVITLNFKNLKKKKNLTYFFLQKLKSKKKAAENKETFDLKISKTQMKKNW